LKITELTKDIITGLILTGGEGSRVGGKDKGLLSFEGERLIERQIKWLAPQVNNIIISANRNIKEYQQLGYSALKDGNNNFDGPLYGVLKGLENCKTEWLFVQPIDVPNLPNDIIQQLIKAIYLTELSDSYFLKTSQQNHYLSLLINTKHLNALKVFIAEGNRKVSLFLREINCLPIDLNLNECAFKNLNKKEDY
jgi:molybdopterin-guanine dinucleotide biosynthesis protein A